MTKKKAGRAKQESPSIKAKVGKAAAARSVPDIRPETPPEKGFPIVGIGASAEGLGANGSRERSKAMTKKKPVQIKADVPPKNSPAPDKPGQAGRGLRLRTGKKAGAGDSKIRETLSPEAARQVLHELRVHQIELEMKNEELRRAREELGASQGRYFDLYDLAPIGYCILDRKGLIMEANLTAATLLGVARGSLIKQPITRFILPEDQDSYSRICEQLFETGSPQVFEFRMLRANAAPFWVRVEATVAEAADGTVACRVVVSDITERKQAEIRLQESNAKYEAIFEATGTATMLVEEDATIIRANSECLAATGYRPEELLGTKWPTYVAPESLEMMLKYHHLRREEPGNAPIKYEVRLVNKKGEIRNVVLDIAMIPGTKRSVVSMSDITERKAAEEALQKANERLLLAIVAGGVGIWELDVVKNKLTWDDQMFRLYGVTPDNFIGAYETWKARVHPEDVERSDAEVQMAWRGEKEYDTEFRVVWPSGAIHHIRARARVHRDAAGQSIKLIGTNYDITERKQAVEALRESEERFRGLYENATIGLYRTTPDGKIFLANRAMVKMLGYTSFEEISTRNLEKIGFEPSYSRRQFNKKFENESEVRGLESVWTRKDGSLVYIRESARAIRDAEGNILYYDGTVEDITERKVAEKALRISEEKYRLLVENAAEAILVAQDGMLKFVNHIASEIIGYSKEELLSSPFLDFIHPDDRNMVGERYLRRLAGDASQPRYEFRLVARDGSIKWVELNAIQVDWEGRPAVLNFLSDITERKRGEEALRENESRYRELFEAESDAIVLIDNATGNILEANSAAAALYGYDCAELLTKRNTDLSAEQEETQRVTHETPIISDKVVTIPLRFHRKKDGTVFPVEITGRFFIREGRSVHIAAIRDITERKRGEEALRQAEENFRRSLDESPLGIRIVTFEGETLYANRAILDIYGYGDIEELRSTPIKKRYTPASYAEYQIRKKMRTNGEACPSGYEISIIRKTGERRRVQVLRKDILWNGQKQFQSIYRDITETQKLEEKLQESLSGMRKAFDGIIQVLSTISEKRDPYTAGHQTRVADLTRAIAQDMGLSAERVEGVRLAGTIHDIGKVSVPAEILSKPARLTNIEFDMVKSHPQVGYEILHDVDFSWPLAEMVLEHHERMDGSGYPKGLKGEAILLEARILAVADVVEAMASHRPYRPALGIEAALEEIEKNRGILYDSSVVSACLGLFREKRFAFK